MPSVPYLVIPGVSSDRREYVPIGWLEPPAIPSNLVYVLEESTLADFALLTSAMHMAWLRHVGGRLGSGYRYSKGLVYNTFPIPKFSATAKSKLELLAQGILDARGEFTGSTLANLYDPNLMPANLRKAHQALDRAVDRIYKRSGFDSERSRIEHLLLLYENCQSPLHADMASKKNARKRK